VERSVDVFHKGNALLGQIRDELAEGSVVEATARKRDDVDIESKFASQAMDDGSLA
jgi:hypothetical protein